MNDVPSCAGCGHARTDHQPGGCVHQLSSLGLPCHCPGFLTAATRRASYLLQSDTALLNAWGRQVRRMFGAMPYLVGSALERPDYRDIDVRLIVLDDDEHERLRQAVALDSLNLAISLWGQKVTGLPIDFQVQSMAEANDDPSNKGKLRNPIGMLDAPERPPAGGTVPTDPEVLCRDCKGTRVQWHGRFQTTCPTCRGTGAPTDPQETP